jgi:hypothetical protein
MLVTEVVARPVGEPDEKGTYPDVEFYEHPVRIRMSEVLEYAEYIGHPTAKAHLQTKTRHVIIKETAEQLDVFLAKHDHES